MSTATPPPEATAAEARVLLRGVSWETYERLLAEQDETTGPRLTFDRGYLEIMTLSLEHEQPNRRLALLVGLILLEWETNFEEAGSHTFKRADLEKGFEPDSCFYIQHAEAVRGKKRLDLAFDPPPDLVIEVEVTAPFLPRLPIFAAAGVPEVWRCDATNVEVLRLADGQYAPAQASVVVAGLTASKLSEFLHASRTQTAPVWARSVRAWAQENVPH